MSYKIKEIFCSIQGEGFHAGTAAIFVRFSGCNLKCDFCDTDFSRGKKMEVEEIIVAMVKQNRKVKTVILTGGEPLMQVDETLVAALLSAGYAIHIETNGTLLPKFQPLNRNIWWTVSPKANEYQAIKWGDEIKVVYTGQSEIQLKRYQEQSFEHFYLQPCSMENIETIVEIIKQEPKWKLSYQIQKAANLR